MCAYVILTYSGNIYLTVYYNLWINSHSHCFVPCIIIFVTLCVRNTLMFFVRKIYPYFLYAIFHYVFFYFSVRFISSSFLYRNNNLYMIFSILTITLIGILVTFPIQHNLLGASVLNINTSPFNAKALFSNSFESRAIFPGTFSQFAFSARFSEVYSNQPLIERDWRPLPLEMVLSKTRNCTWGVGLAPPNPVNRSQRQNSPGLNNPLRGSTPTAAALRRAARCMKEATQSPRDPVCR